MTLSNPLGVGLGGFQQRIGEYCSATGRDAHNAYLLISSEMGLASLLIFLGLILQLFKRGWQGIYRGGEEVSRKAGLALVGGMFALLLTNFFSATLRETAVFSYVWVLAAIVFRASENGDEGFQEHK